MTHPIIETTSMTQAWRQWLNTPAGAYLLNWEQSQLDQLVADVFGYHALQLGMPELMGLRSNRMPHQWMALSEEPPKESAVEPSKELSEEFTKELKEETQAKFDFAAHSIALPFKPASLDLLVMPHTLELSLDAHASLREAERVLVPEGHLVITGLNPASLWGWRHHRAQWYKRWGYDGLSAPPCDELIGYWRLRDWLRLLGFEVKLAHFGCWRPALDKPKWFQRWSWLDKLGANWWPILGGAYVIVAVKKVHGGRILGATWKLRRSHAKSAVTIAHSQTNTQKGKVELDRKPECEPR
jgi:SAM-dependent methyltransferase